MKPVINSETHKWCAGCKTSKPSENFSKNHRNRLGLDAYCKQCMRTKSKKYTKNRTVKRQILKAKLVMEFGNKCSDCLVEDLPIASYVFHHHNEKMNSKTYKSPSSVITTPQWKNITKEKKKWIMLCSNCHSVRHSNYKFSASKLLQ